MKHEGFTPIGQTGGTGTQKNPPEAGSNAGQTAVAPLPDATRVAAWLARQRPADMDRAAVSRASRRDEERKARSRVGVGKRPIRIDGDIAYITLTKGYEASIDATDVHLVQGRNWSADEKGRTVYAKATFFDGLLKRTVMLHRLVMQNPYGLEVDHIDGNGLNNRRTNLRTASDGENARNRRKPHSNTSGFKGVSWFKGRNKWRAQIKMEGRSIHLGLFDSPDLAHQAYKNASVRIHGNFGRSA